MIFLYELYIAQPWETLSDHLAKLVEIELENYRCIDALEIEAQSSESVKEEIYARRDFGLTILTHYALIERCAAELNERGYPL